MVYSSKRRGSSGRETNVKVIEGLKVIYANVDGLLSAKLEINDILRDKEPEVMCIVETKLRVDNEVQIGQGKYNLWRRDRTNKAGGGLLIATKKNLIVSNLVMGEDEAEIIKLSISGGRGKRDLIVTYVPPKTNAWSTEEYQNMLRETTDQLYSLVEGSNKPILLGDFNCKEVNWEQYTTPDSDESWGNALLNLVMENLMIQWVDKETRYRNGDTPARLDLIFTKEAGIIDSLNYLTPLGKSDHDVIEFRIKAEAMARNEEKHKIGRLNFTKADYSKLSQYFNESNWEEFEQAKDVQSKWNKFMEIYELAVDKIVPRIVKDENRRNPWFNGRCNTAKRKRDKAWRKWRKTRTAEAGNEYKTERNEYVRIRREEEKNFERGIVEKCKKEPKLFYKFVNGKLKEKQGIEKLKFEGKIYYDPRQQAEIMNQCFEGVFTNEGEFEEIEQVNRMKRLSSIQVERQEILKLMEGLDVRKASGPDGISNWVLKECREELVDKIRSILVCSLNEGKVPHDWKSSIIVPIYKGGSKEDPLNYRPVSLTSVVGKLCERIVKDRWVKYLEELKIISDSQFGFRTGNSCASNLLCFYSRVIDTVQERDGWADCVYLDLKKSL